MFSTRSKKAIKASLAVVIAYAIALHMDWEKPYWAAYTALTISLASSAEGIHKGLMRLTGGLVGAVIGFVLLAFFIQERWLFMAWLSLYAATFTYLALGSKNNNYFWHQAGFFATVIAFDSAFQPLNAFEIGIERAQEVGAGLVTYIAVTFLLWPENSRRDLEQSAAELITNIRQLWGERTALVGGGDGVHATPGLRERIRALQAQSERLLGAAETDSWEVAEARSAWRFFQAQTAELSETLARSRSDLDEAQGRHFERVAPGLRSFLEEIDRRLALMEGMFAGHKPASLCAPMVLELDGRSLESLSHFDRAGVTVQRERLQNVEIVTRALFESVCVITGFECDAARENDPRAHSPFRVPATRFSLDRDHLDEALRSAASIWLMFIAIVYIPGLPAGLGSLGIATRLAFVGSAIPSVSLTVLFAPVVAAMAGAFPFYFLLMPQLSSFPELAVAVSVVVFAIVYIFHEPRQALWRTIVGYLFLTMISVTNEQTYSFVHYATSVLMWLVVLAVLAVTEYVPIPHQPDRVFLRLLNRFFRSCEFLLRIGRVPKRERSLVQRLKAGFYTYEVVTLPTKLDQWGRSLSPAVLGRSTPGQVHTFVNGLCELSDGMQALLEARTAHQSAAVVRELRPDMRAWRTGAGNILRGLEVEPQSAEHEDLRSCLRSTLTRLEARIEEALDKTNGKSMTAEESENLYRLLSAQRGVSTSLVQLTKQAAAVDWECLRETRF